MQRCEVQVEIMKEIIFLINFLLVAVLLNCVGGNSESDVCFRCGGREGDCLDSHRVCDNFIDCPDASDESTASGGGCFMKKVCEEELAEDKASHNKSVVLYGLVAIVSVESVAIFAVALFALLRRRPESTCPHKKCKKCRREKKKEQGPVFSTNVNIYELRRKRSDQDLLTGPLYVEASSKGGEIVTRHPPVGFPQKYSKDVRYFDCNHGNPNQVDKSIHFETPPKEKIYEEIKR